MKKNKTKQNHCVVFTAGFAEQCPSRVFKYGFPSLVSQTCLTLLLQPVTYMIHLLLLWGKKNNNPKTNIKHRRHFNVRLNIQLPQLRPPHKTQSTRDLQYCCIMFWTRKQNYVHKGKKCVFGAPVFSTVKTSKPVGWAVRRWDETNVRRTVLSMSPIEGICAHTLATIAVTVFTNIWIKNWEAATGGKKETRNWEV